MAKITETAYLTRDNANILTLGADVVDVDFSAVTRVDLIDLGCTWEVSSVTEPAAVTWSHVSPNLVVTFKLGLVGMPLTPLLPGEFDCRVMVYDASNTHGVAWGDLKFKLVEAC